MKKCSVTADSLLFDALFMKYSWNFIDSMFFFRNFMHFPMRQVIFHEMAVSSHEIASFSHGTKAGLPHVDGFLCGDSMV